MNDEKSFQSAHFRQRQIIRRITITAMFIGLSTVSKFIFSFTIPLFGADGMKVGLSGVFNAFPAMLFGPVWGGFTSAASDIIGCIVKPTGAYNPLFTLTAFAGGFIKGAIWMFLTSKIKKTLTSAICVLLTAIGVFGGICHFQILNDGVQSGFASSTVSLMTRGNIEKAEENGNISTLSKTLINIAKYNNDTITLSGTSGVSDSAIIVPSSVAVDGYSSKVTKIGANAFNGIDNTEIYLPDTVKTVDTKAFSECVNITVVISEKSPLKDSIADICSNYRIANVDTIKSNTSSETMTDGMFTYKTSDTFRKNLSGYINFITLGLEATAIFGLLFIIIDTVTQKIRKSKGKDSGNYIYIFTAIFTSGLIVTTINTVILWQIAVPAYKSREFLILWTPRVIEELIVCLIQTYIITLLYDIFTKAIKKNSSMEIAIRSR